MPAVAPGGQDHQGQEPSRRKAQRLASDEPDLDQVAGLGKVLAVASLQRMRHPHRTAGRQTLGDFNVRDVGVVLQGESSERATHHS